MGAKYNLHCHLCHCVSKKLASASPSLRLCRNCTNTESFPTFVFSSNKTAFHHHHFRYICNKQTDLEAAEEPYCPLGLYLYRVYYQLCFPENKKITKNTGNSPGAAGPVQGHQHSPFLLQGSCHRRYWCFHQLGQSPKPGWQFPLKMLFPLSLPSHNHCHPFSRGLVPHLHLGACSLQAPHVRGLTQPSTAAPLGRPSSPHCSWADSRALLTGSNNPSSYRLAAS